jgi:hypothetical protein
MTRFLVAVLAFVAITGLTGLNGCRAYQFQVVQPPGTTTLDDAIVVIMDTHTGNNVVVPYPQFITLRLDQYGSVDELKKALKESGAKSGG